MCYGLLVIRKMNITQFIKIIIFMRTCLYIVQLFLILIKTLNINKLGAYPMGYKLRFNIQQIFSAYRYKNVIKNATKIIKSCVSSFSFQFLFCHNLNIIRVIIIIFMNTRSPEILNNFQLYYLLYFVIFEIFVVFYSLCFYCLICL